MDESGARGELKDQEESSCRRPCKPPQESVIYPQVHELTSKDFEQRYDMCWFSSYKNQFDYSLENMLEWDKFEGYLETITEIYMKDNPVLNWPGDIENGKKMHRFVYTFESFWQMESTLWRLEVKEKRVERIQRGTSQAQ